MVHRKGYDGTKGNHFDEKGNAIMVDLSKKATCIAKAEGYIKMNEAAFRVVEGGTSERRCPRNSAYRRIMAVKQTSSLIPFVIRSALKKRRLILKRSVEKMRARSVLFRRREAVLNGSALA